MSYSTSESILSEVGLPNLPGYRINNPRKSAAKKSVFSLIGGKVFLKENMIPSTSVFDPAGRSVGGPANIISSLNSTAEDFPRDDSSQMSLGTTNTVALRKLLSNNEEDISLSFQAYFILYEEGEAEFKTEFQRVFGDLDNRKSYTNVINQKEIIRHCKIVFYVNDGSLKISQIDDKNSGFLNGVIVSRSVIYKNDGIPITEEDFHQNAPINIYGRDYYIVGCDNFTSNYLKNKFNIEFSGSLELPKDQYTQYRERNDPGKADSWGKFHSKKNENKKFIEAKFGHATENKTRAGYLKYDNKQLKFLAVWDDRDHLYGEIINYVIVYYLADDTIEIQVKSSNDYTQSGSRLVKRSKLPKNGEYLNQLGSSPNDNDFYKWSDLDIGHKIAVFGRNLLIVDADDETKHFFYHNGYQLSEPIKIETSVPVITKREIPPHTGFGSEEDSLRSVTRGFAASVTASSSISASKLARIQKYSSFESKVLSFVAKLKSTDDNNAFDGFRRFVITFHVQDGTVKVVEPPVRNSGFQGGVFLSRRVIPRVPKGEGDLDETDLSLGCCIRVLNHEFILLESNEMTLHWMEEQNFPQSSLTAIIKKIRNRLYNIAANGNLKDELLQESEKIDAENSSTTPYGLVNADALRAVLNNYNLLLPFGSPLSKDSNFLCEHEVLTILRNSGENIDQDYYLNVDAFINYILDA